MTPYLHTYTHRVLYFSTPFLKVDETRRIKINWRISSDKTSIRYPISVPSSLFLLGLFVVTLFTHQNTRRSLHYTEFTLTQQTLGDLSFSQNFTKYWRRGEGANETSNHKDPPTTHCPKSSRDYTRSRFLVDVVDKD